MSQASQTTPAKFLITGDWHVKGIAPRARLDDFKTTLFRKIREVFSLAARHQVTAIIVPGDILDSPQTTLGTLAELGRLLQDAPCPVLAIPGNHDLWGGNPASKFRTPYGLLAQLGLLHDLTFREFRKENPWNKMPEIFVTGHGFTVETDTPLGINQFRPPLDDDMLTGNMNVFSIHVVHSMLMDRRPGFDMRHTLISEVKTMAKVIVSGHEHLGFGVVRRDDGVLFVNPGALCRLSAHTAEMERQVGVALLTVNSVNDYSAEIIPLKSALPGHEVLSREHLESEVERSARLDKFLALLASEGESKFLEVRDIIEDIAARDNLPADVKAEALRRIGEAREQLGMASNVMEVQA